jgi:hypothetical protein
MLLEFLAKNIPHAKAMMIFDSLGELKEQKILANLNKDDLEIIHHITINFDSLIKLIVDKMSVESSETRLIILEDNIVAIRRIDQNKIVILLLSPMITLESEILQCNNFVN